MHFEWLHIMRFLELAITHQTVSQTVTQAVNAANADARLCAMPQCCIRLVFNRFPL